jgi:hypothetical protein
VSVNENEPADGDGAASVGEHVLNTIGLKDGEALVFDLA